MAVLNIFVSMGTHPKPFLRLLNEIKRLQEKDKNLSFFIQSGSTPIEGLKGMSFLSKKVYDSEIKRADLVIAHCGAGIMMNAFDFKKPLILVPRLKKFDEHSNDHQKELAEKLSEEKNALMVLDINALEKTIKESLKLKSNFKPTKDLLAKDIREFIEEIESEA